MGGDLAETSDVTGLRKKMQVLLCGIIDDGAVTGLVALVVSYGISDAGAVA